MESDVHPHEELSGSCGSESEIGTSEITILPLTLMTTEEPSNNGNAVSSVDVIVEDHSNNEEVFSFIQSSSDSEKQIKGKQMTTRNQRKTTRNNIPLQPGDNTTDPDKELISFDSQQVINPSSVDTNQCVNNSESDDSEDDEVKYLYKDGFYKEIATKEVEHEALCQNDTLPHAGICTIDTCTIEMCAQMLECNKCKKLTHYACTGLPAYQVSLFLTKNYRIYTCENCVGQINEDLVLTCLSRDSDNLNRKAEAEKLNQENNSLKLSLKSHEEESDKLNNRCKLNEEEIQRLLDENQRLKNENIQLRLSQEDRCQRISKSVQTLSDTNETSQKLLKNNNKLTKKLEEVTLKLSEKSSECKLKNAEINTLSEKLVILQNSEGVLNSLLEERENDVIAVQSKLHIAEQCNDDASKVYKTIDTLKAENRRINEKVTDLRKKEDVLKQQLNNKSNIIEKLKKDSHTAHTEVPSSFNIDEKLDTFSTTLLTKVSELVDRKLYNINASTENGESYAAVSQSGCTSPSKASIPTDFRTILKETENEKLKEENDQRARACNLIIHGVAEDGENSLTAADEIYVSNLLTALSVNGVTAKAVHRIGKQNDNKKRPLKVIMRSEHDKEKVMSNLTNLKDKAIYKGMSISADYTINERNLLKEFSMNAKERNEELGPDSKYIWRVRGSPKNGLVLKKFLKQRSTVVSA